MGSIQYIIGVIVGSKRFDPRPCPDYSNELLVHCGFNKYIKPTYGFECSTYLECINAISTSMHVPQIARS